MYYRAIVNLLEGTAFIVVVRTLYGCIKLLCLTESIADVNNWLVGAVNVGI